MAYPPPLPPAGRVNSTPQADNHPADHNTLVAAMTDILNELGSDPSGGFANVMARINAIDATLPLIQWGLFNGNTDGNGYARPSWPTAYPGIASSGDNGNLNTCGITCIQSRGAGSVLQVPHMMYSLGGFNAKNCIVRCFQVFNNVATPVASSYCPFHFMVWGPRVAGQTSAGTVS